MKSDSCRVCGKQMAIKRYRSDRQAAAAMDNAEKMSTKYIELLEIYTKLNLENMKLRAELASLEKIVDFATRRKKKPAKRK